MSSIKPQNFIVFVGKTPFPVNTASSNRVYSIAKGLIAFDASVSVYCFGLVKKGILSNSLSYKGTIDNISWFYPSFRTASYDSRIIRGLFLILGQVIGYPIILYKYFNKKPYFFTSQLGFAYLFPLWIVSRICGGKVILYRSEYPLHILKNKKTSLLHSKFTNFVTYKMFDGLFLMTHNLKSYFEKYKKKKAFIEILPLSIDIDEFNKNTPSPYSFPYIAYCGSLSNAKDGVDILIKSFAKISSGYPKLRLLIIGDGKDMIALKNLAKNLLQEESEKIIFTGLVGKVEVIRYITNASALALARPRSKQAEGGFPSKLGEYLATGKPVVVTNSGEISSYLSDLVNARIANTDDIKDFVNKLKWVLDNPNEAKVLGEKGRLVAKAYFDMNVVASKILNKIIDA
jgi:glycosyltransferase involved in cell wall biosynthesis